MPTIYDPNTLDELIQRIQSLTEKSTGQWGKMTVKQMVRHCIANDEMNFGKLDLKQGFLGRLIGKPALKSFIRNKKDVQRNMGTLPELKITSEVTEDMQTLKSRWITSLQNYAKLDQQHTYVHSFFGKLNREQIGILAYKHMDHHLRQFGV